MSFPETSVAEVSSQLPCILVLVAVSVFSQPLKNKRLVKLNNIRYNFGDDFFILCIVDLNYFFSGLAGFTNSMPV
jgi:hypothetical protein